MKNFINNSLSLYSRQTPSLSRILSLIGGYKGYDHVAFRSFPGGLDIFTNFINQSGDYTEKNHLYFPEKHINAKWFKPINNSDPRIFVSELDISKLSSDAQSIIQQKQLESSVYIGDSSLPNFQDYQKLKNESEYAAWTYLFGSQLNHATISVHGLDENMNTLEKFHEVLKKHDIELSTVGGEIKTSPDGLLHQSSTCADKKFVVFDNHKLESIPGTFVEFIQRDIIDSHGNRREGFEVANANEIFESTTHKLD